MNEEGLSRLQALAWEWHHDMILYHISELAVSGGDVISFLERKGGPWLGDLMKNLLMNVACGDLPNEKESILEHAKVVVNSQSE
ncbi:CCA-adding enzyme [compost metagenome]